MVRRSWLVVLAMIIAVSAVGFAQDLEKAKTQLWSFYKLDLTVREMDGTRIVNSRSYTLSGRGDEWTRIRIGSKVPTTGGQYMDVGLNVDARLYEFESGPALSWTIDFSSLAGDTPTAGNMLPVVRSVRSQGYSPLVLGKPVLLSSSDDLNSTHKFVFEVTATKVK